MKWYQNIRLLSLVFVLLLSLYGVAHAHDWYSWQCCGGHDCHPISDCSELIPNKQGGYTWHGFNFDADQIQPSHDNQCHVCVSADETGKLTVPHCAYIPFTN